VEPFIAMSAGSSVRQLTDVAMAQAEASPTTLVEARNIATAGGIIAAGLGVSAFPEFVLPLMSSTHIATRPLHGPTMYRDIAVITRAGTALSPPAQRFVERLRARFS
jgi:DNA-binding transcriptional LysR family regulator